MNIVAFLEQCLCLLLYQEFFRYMMCRNQHMSMHWSFKAASSRGNMIFDNLKVWPSEAGFPHLVLANFTLIADFSSVQINL